MGCGPRDFGSDWVHIDGGDFDHLHSRDVRNLPFKDNEVDLIYASHVFEYFDRQDSVNVLSEWRRVLKPNGLLRLAVPDFKSMIELYQEGLPLDYFLGPLYGRINMGDDLIYHKTVYDETSLCNLLVKNGFFNPRRWDWRKQDHGLFDDNSQAYLPHMDKENGTLISLNIEAAKS